MNAPKAEKSYLAMGAGIEMPYSEFEIVKYSWVCSILVGVFNFQLLTTDEKFCNLSLTIALDQ